MDLLGWWCAGTPWLSSSVYLLGRAVQDDTVRYHSVTHEYTVIRTHKRNIARTCSASMSVGGRRVMLAAFIDSPWTATCPLRRDKVFEVVTWKVLDSAECHVSRPHTTP